MKTPIVTTRKKAFLRKEYNMFQFKGTGYKAFLELFESDARQCAKCGVWYWDTCKMRCNCLNVNNENKN